MSRAVLRGTKNEFVGGDVYPKEAYGNARENCGAPMMVVKAIFCASAFMIAHAAHAESLCESTETIIFSCQLKEGGKFVSICSSKDLSFDHGFLQYRYGGLNDIELRYPQDAQGSKSNFYYASYGRTDLSAFVLGFTNNGYQYEISDTTERGGDNGTTTRALLISSRKYNAKTLY